MKKIILYASVLLLGMASCSKEYAVSEEEMPEWLGSSIYENLQTGNNLTGTFNTYLRLIDDCGQKEILSRSGSKTIFPANDEAFAAFFANANNKYGASSYEDLTLFQKQEILFSSMLDNAILVGNLSSKQNSVGALVQGQVVKHETNLKNEYYTNTSNPWFSQTYPLNNKYFQESQYQGSIATPLYDDSNPPMVHFTKEYFLNNNITILGANSDFSILTGNEYTEGAAYVFDKMVMPHGEDYEGKPIYGNVTCQNGYIHQLNGVLTNPGNMAQIIRQDPQFSLFNRMLGYFAVPYTSTKYPNYTTIRYLSKNSQREVFNVPRVGVKVTDERLLNFDPGWNMYNPTLKSGLTEDDQEIAAVLAPTDAAVKQYFLSEGKYILANLGVKNLPVNESTISQHLDAVYNSDPAVVVRFLNNVFKPSFSKCVPSKFSTVQNDAFEFIQKNDGEILAALSKKNDGKYDVTIANNGVIYKMNRFFTPELYNSVLGPASVYVDMRTMGEMLNDHQTVAGKGSALGADMYYYLLSMMARYAVFCPTDNSKTFKFVDPTSIGDDKLAANQLRVLRFRFDENSSNEAGFHIFVDRLYYDTTMPWNDEASFTETADLQGINIGSGKFNTQIRDLLDYSTIVLVDSTETEKVTRKGLYGNTFYRTKNGGAIRVDGTGVGAKVSGGIQIDNANIPASVITQVFDDKSADAKIQNGSVYRLDMPVQPTIKSVYKTLAENADFYDDNADYENDAPEYDHYLNFCSNFNIDDNIYTWCGILNASDVASKESKLKPYKVLGTANRITFFNSYNYTMYVPTYSAMVKAQKDMGLPTWKKVLEVYHDWSASGEFATEAEAKAYVKKALQTMAKFVRYQAHNTSAFADKFFVNTTNEGTEENPHYVTNPNPYYTTFAINSYGIPMNVSASGGGNKLSIIDAAGKKITVDASSATANMLAREIVIATDDEGFKSIKSSSFVTMHGIDTPMCFNSNGSFK